MRAMGRSGAVYQKGQKYWLIKAPDVVIHMAADPEAELTSLPHEAVREVDVAWIAKKTPGPIMDVETLATDLRRSGVEYGVLASSEKLAFVTTVTRSLHEMLLSGPADCYCSKTGKPVTGRNHGDPCPDRDGGTVWCG